ncbi:hypothetical protein HCJ46_11690 [Listeria booriae]|uniref:hypothetical protein n=1 Tax=Listeria booriae TaxID=1552123 RepID=UPI0016290A56|nr:hypothetical protein [Listeria booriae]MBC1919404.1 hypothetical protein [Listeria booriae]MBC2067008.1 hypothetical protein [Listeria booriae]
MKKKYKVWLKVLTRNGWGSMVYGDIEALSYSDALEIANRKAKKSGYRNIRKDRVNLQGFK